MGNVCATPKFEQTAPENTVGRRSTKKKPNNKDDEEVYPEVPTEEDKAEDFFDYMDDDDELVDDKPEYDWAKGDAGNEEVVKSPSDEAAEGDEEDPYEEAESGEEIPKEDLHQAHVKWPKRLPREYAKTSSERGMIFKDAKRIGDARSPDETVRHITVIYNPVSGAGAAKRLVEHMVEPILNLAKVKYTVVPTEYRRFAVEFMQKLDPSMTDGIIISGGDGLVHEVITGYFTHPDQDAMRKLPVGICPSGTANAMAKALHKHPSKTNVSLVGRAALACVKGTTTKVDVLQIEKPDETIFALSVFGWGLAGAVAKKADKLRWIPGQKKARYDIAGFVTMIRDWPVIDKAKFEYKIRKLNKQSGEMEDAWKTENIGLINMCASNLAYLGEDHPISPDVSPTDGHVAVVITDQKANRRDVVSLAMGMKKGEFLQNQRKVRSYYTTEFKLTPTKAKSPYNIDGDPHDHSPVHVTVLNQALTVFALPETGSSHAMKGLGAAAGIALGVMGLNTADVKVPHTVDPKHQNSSIAALVKSVGGQN